MVNSGKHIIFMVISLLVVMLIYGSVAVSSYSAFAAFKSPRDICPSSGLCLCNNDVEHLKAKCCDFSKNSTYCVTCDINTDTGDYENCVLSRKAPTTGQGGGVLEQPPPTPKKHSGTALPKGGGVLEQPSTDQGTIQSPPTNNKLKGSDLGQIGGGDLTTTKKGKSPTPTPPPCPTDNSPIPPNCTLKPKF